MGLTLSSLTITERTLNETGAPTPLAVQAREVAAAFIADRGGARGWGLFLPFFSSLSNARALAWERQANHIVLSAPCPTAIISPYGLKGGAAREHLVSALNLRQARAPRDIDLIRKGSHAIPEDERVARELMTRDYRHGARVELVRDMARHLATRDLTINEVASFQSQIFASPLAILDSVGHVARPSSYRAGTLHRAPSLDGRVLLKMLRLYAEGSQASEAWRVVGIPEEVSFSETDLALHLNKAFQRGEAVARAFLEACQTISLLAASSDPLRSTLDELAHLRHGENGLLPDVPHSWWD